MQKTGLTGIILCGGNSERMGMNKANLKFGQLTVIEMVIHNLKPLCDDLIISTNNQDLDYLGLKKTEDKLRGIGPIAGVLSGLSESVSEHNLLVSCDTPFIPTGLFNILLRESKDYDIVLPSYHGHVQSLTGYFNKSILPFIYSEVKKGNTKPVRIFESLHLKILEIGGDMEFYTDHLFLNINTPEDYQEALKIFAKIRA